MALNFSNGFNITSNEPIDSRIIKTKAEMKALTPPQQKRMPSIYFCLCSDDNKFYLFDINHADDPETGKFRPLEDYIDFKSAASKANLDAAVTEAINTSSDVREAVENAVGDIKVDGGYISDVVIDDESEGA